MLLDMKTYVPRPLPIQSLDWVELIPLIAQANRALARYDGLLQSLVNPDILLSPLRTQEAVLSSRIEGTQASLRDVLEFEAAARPDDIPADADIREILNYRLAMQYAVESLETRPISLRLIRDIHAMLLDSVRGANKARGEFRTSQNFIGPAGARIDQATCIPPPPGQLPDLLNNLEQYIHGDEPDLVAQLALIHAQFELIHPFLDGNGRVGRILIPLFLYERQILSWPAFFMSAYLESHRDEYYVRLRSLSENEDYQSWVQFFLDAVVRQAEANMNQVREIMALYERMKVDTAELTRSHTAIQALDALFARPIFSTAQFSQQVGASRRTCSRLLRSLSDGGVIQLRRSASGQLPAVYEFNELLDIVR